MKRLLDSRNRGSQSPPPPIIHTASLAPGGGHIHEPPPPGGVPRPPRELAPPSSPEAHGGPASAKSKLQSLHWIKINRAVQGTLWEEFERDGEGQSAPPEIDIAELEELFSDVAPEKVDSKEAEKKCPEKVQLIDPSRANAIEIMLTKVKMSLSNMTCAILAMDGEILNVDQLKSILKWIPTREEMAKLKNYNIETDIRMRKCEKYFMELMKVPRMESKVMIFLFKSQFNTQLAKFKKNLKTVNSACQEVQNCNKLKEIVKKILHFGNTINLKSPKGSEVGFKLDTLLKLVNKQALNGKITLMHCLCKVLASKSPDLLDFHEDLVNLEAASKMPTKKLGDEMHVILNGLKKSKHELDTSENDGPISNYFRMRLKEFIGFAEPEVTSVTNFYQVAGRNTYTLALYLGEDPASCPFEQATLTLINFVKLFRKCLEENSTQAEGVTSHGSLALPRGASPPPPPPTGASTQSGEPWPRVGPPSPPPPPPTGPLCAPQPLYERPLGDDPGSGPAKASRPPPPPPVPKVSPPLPAAAWPLSLHPFGGSLGGYPGRGYEPGTPDELPHPPGRLGGGLGRGRRGGGPAVRNSNQKPLHLVTMTRVVKGSLWEEFQLDGERYNTFLNMHPPVPPTPHPPSVYVEPAPPPPPMHEVPRPPPPPPSPGGGKPQLIDGAPPSPPPPPGAPTPPPPGGTLRPPGPPPPPGVPGPPNGPPPPPGRLGPGKACGPAVKKSNLKPLFWFKVTRAVKGSLREEIQKIREGQSSPPEFEISELEAYFSNAPKKVVSKEAEKKKAFSLKPEQVQLIDMRRANNTLTMLTKVKMSYPEIVTAILAMDGTLIDADILENILKCCPTKEEMEQLKNYQGEKELLGKCENVCIKKDNNTYSTVFIYSDDPYFLELMKVPRMETKLTVLLFKTQFNTQLKKFKKSLNTVNSACDEVRKSIKLSDVIKRILYLPDTLSQGTARGVVAGFNLDSFMELVDTRSSISKMNLMHYLCKVFAAKAPALLDFPEDLVSLEAATKIQLKDLKEMPVIFHDGLQKAKHELDASANDGPISQGFCMGLKEFISFAEAEVTVVTNLYTVARRRANGLALYIGAGLAHCPFEQAIQTLHNFVRLFQKCHEDNQKHEDNENKRKQDGQMTKPYNRLLEVRKASKNMEIKSLVALSHPPPPPGPKNSRSLSPPTLITRTTAPTPPPIHEIPLPPPRASIPGPPRPPPLPGGGTPQLIPGPPPPPGAPTPTPPPPPVGVTKPPGVPGPPPPPSEVPRPPGAPVGPPPPPGQLGKGPVRAPATNMKPLHWFKVTRAVKRSMPEEFQLVKRPPPEFDDKEIETYFSNAAPKKVAPKEAETKKAASSKPEVVQLIDMRRANNMLIMLTEVKMPYPEIVDAILQMDGTLIDADRLENILKFCPTKEEMEQLKNYQGDKNMLGRCEEYFLELMRVPRMESKVNCFLFKTQFNTQLAEFKKSLNIVNAACDEVRKSDKLKGIMKKILYLGNTLNQGTARGSAIGFKLDSLFKLTDTRSSISKITLMHYLCKVLASKAPDLLDFHEDLVSLEAATKIQLKTLAEEMNSLAIGLKKVKLELDACRNDGEVSEGFHNALESFVGYAEAEVTSVTNFYSVVGRNADALALYFGEDPARCPFEQAIQTLHNFVRLFQKCQKDDVGPIVDERTIVSQEAQDRVTKGAPLKWV